MKKLTAIVCIGLLTALGCATVPTGHPIEIYTDPPGAAISVDGAYIGDSPVTADIQGRCVWVGVLYAPGGYRCDLVRVQAEPKSTMPGKLYSRTAMVNPREMASKKILMNLYLEPVSPTQTVEVK